MNKMNHIINDGKQIENLKIFLTGLDGIKKDIKSRPCSVRASSRYGQSITTAIVNSENKLDNANNFVAWLRAQD